MCNCSLKNQRIQIGILYPMVPVSSQKISMPMKSCLIQFGVKCFRFSVARGRRTVIYTSESSNRNSAILRGPGILGDLHICNPTLRETEKQAILSLPYGRITNTYSLLTRFPIPLYLVNTWIQITLTGLPNVSLKPPHSFSFSA